MTDQNLNSNPMPAPEAVPPVAETPPTWQVILTKIKIIVINIFSRFYSTKRVFWPVSITFGLIFLILIVGLLFGGKGTKKTTTGLPTPTPFVLSSPVASASADVLPASETKLNQLKTKIDNLDIKQSRLQPPTLNFDVKF